MLEALEKAKNEVQSEIDYTKDRIKLAKIDIKKLIKSKDGAIEAGIDDYVFEDKIDYITGQREKLVNRLEVLKKVKYRIEVSIRMLQEV